VDDQQELQKIDDEVERMMKRVADLQAKKLAKEKETQIAVQKRDIKNKISMLIRRIHPKKSPQEGDIDFNELFQLEEMKETILDTMNQRLAKHLTDWFKGTTDLEITMDYLIEQGFNKVKLHVTNYLCNIIITRLFYFCFMFSLGIYSSYHGHDARRVEH
jgi:DNA anti-recombination protein RmuC